MHAQIDVHDGRVTLSDLGSANGSFVQDERLSRPHQLHDGDRLRLGSMLLKYDEHHNVNAALHHRIYRMAMVDAGTGLYNRRYLNETLRRALRQSRQSGRPMAVISVDLNHFKAVNDTHGQAAGGLVLREGVVVLNAAVSAAVSAAVNAAVSAAVGAGTAEGVTLGRLGGEEFLLLLPDATQDATRAG